TLFENIDPEPLSEVPANLDQPYNSARQPTILMLRRFSYPMVLVAAFAMLVTSIAALSLGNAQKVLYGAPAVARSPHLDTSSGEAGISPEALSQAVTEHPQVIPEIQFASRVAERLIESGRRMVAEADLDKAVASGRIKEMYLSHAWQLTVSYVS